MFVGNDTISSSEIEITSETETTEATETIVSTSSDYSSKIEHIDNSLTGLLSIVFVMFSVLIVTCCYRILKSIF